MNCKPVPRDVGAQLEELRAKRILAALDQVAGRFLPQLRAPDRRAIAHKQPADGGVLRRADRSECTGHSFALLGYAALLGQDGSTPFLQRAFRLRDLGQDVVDPLPNLRRSIRGLRNFARLRPGHLQVREKGDLLVDQVGAVR